MTKFIAELCQNHLGNRKILKQMVEEAASAGADFCKIQSMRAKDLTLRERFELGETDSNGRINVIKRPYSKEYERLEPLDLSDDDHRFFVDLCKENNVKPLTTAFTRNRVDFLSTLDWGHNMIKIASFDCRSKPLLEDLVSAGFNHLLISTGSTFDEEIEETAELLNGLGCKFTFFHCISIYPTPLNESHLNRMNYLRRFTDSVGLSEHSSYEKYGLKMIMTALASSTEIDYIERHFTILDKDKTKDGVVSLNRAQLRDAVDFSSLSHEKKNELVNQIITKDEKLTILGQEKRQLSPGELLNRDYYHGRFANISGDYVKYNWEY